MKVQTKLAAALLLATAGTAAQAEVSANATVASNYLWRGLTQTVDGPMIGGGIDYSNESGFYAGTWAANVSYAADDTFSYEHDVYFGFAGEAGDVSYDVGYLYYNYNDAGNFDFAEIYATVGFQDFSASYYVLAHTEADEAEGQDFGFGQAYYVSLDYGFDLGADWSAAVHYGYHHGDFVEAFNFGDGHTYDYSDYSVSFAKDAFTFTVSDTDVNDTTGYLSNGDFKYCLLYTSPSPRDA